MYGYEMLVRGKLVSKAPSDNIPGFLEEARFIPVCQTKWGPVDSGSCHWFPSRRSGEVKVSAVKPDSYAAQCAALGLWSPSTRFKQVSAMLAYAFRRPRQWTWVPQPNPAKWGGGSVCVPVTDEWGEVFGRILFRQTTKHMEESND